MLHIKTANKPANVTMATAATRNVSIDAAFPLEVVVAIAVLVVCASVAVCLSAFIVVALSAAACVVV